jgi:hypothetical protein
LCGERVDREKEGLMAKQEETGELRRTFASIFGSWDGGSWRGIAAAGKIEGD